MVLEAINEKLFGKRRAAYDYSFLKIINARVYHFLLQYLVE